MMQVDFTSTRIVPTSTTMRTLPGVIPPRKRIGDRLEKGKESAPTRFPRKKADWHILVKESIKANKWEQLRGILSVSSASEHQRDSSLVKTDDEENRRIKGIWRRISGRSSRELDLGLLALDAEGRTPLHVALQCRKTPQDILLSMIHLAPHTAKLETERGRLPLHLAVLHKHHIEIVAMLVEVFPEALSSTDTKGQTPLAYAVEISKRETDIVRAPKSFWMPRDDDEELSEWQERQVERWGVVHWLLLSSATYPQTRLCVGEKKPMLVDALLFAAPPAVISLLIGASVTLLSFENRATAFAGSTLYSCIARHYPFSILSSLASQCPNDVRTVRDETGMGLVSALFISAMFEQTSCTQEWSVSPLFYDMLQDSIQDGSLVDDSAFYDWWQKIEYLIAFCDGQEYAAMTKEHLLHAALRNPDIPPSVVHLLLVLYPESVRLSDTNSDELPIHLVARSPEYIPRNYEFQISGGEASALTMVLNANPESYHYRCRRRLPVHFAIDEGKAFSSFRLLLDAEENDNFLSLSMRDPWTGLLPFQLAAAYKPKAKDSFRWSCIARNKYSHAVWRGLDSRRKAAALVRVAETEDTDRLTTIYELLRRKPSVLSSSTMEKEGALRIGESMGLVSTHFVNWYYYENGRKCWGIDQEKATLFLMAVTGKFPNASNMPPLLVNWWDRMKFLIRHCLPKEKVADGQDSVSEIHVEDNDEFLLHAALANSDTPPAVIEMLLSFYPTSPRLMLPRSFRFPLHIVCQTQSYTPRNFEEVRLSSLELALKSYPDAVRLACEEGLPLHMAIRAGKTWNELWPLVEEEPFTLRVPDLDTGLFPFQLMAVRRPFSADMILRFHRIARNRYTDGDWEDLSFQGRGQHAKKVRNEFKLAILTSVFELLRKDTSVLHANCGDAECYGTGLCDTMHDCGSNVLQSEVNDADSESEVDESDENCSTTLDYATGPEQVPTAPPTALMRLLSRKNAKDDEVFSCDASAFSSVDVMSTISGAVNQYSRRRAKRPPADDEKSLSITDLMRTDAHEEPSEPASSKNESSSSRIISDEEAETYGGSTSYYSSDYYTEGEIEQMVEMETDPDDSDDESESSHLADDLIYFQIRRNPRYETHRITLQDEDREPLKQVTLCKKDKGEKSVPGRTRSMPVDRPSRMDSLRNMLLSAQGTNSKMKSERALSSLHSDSTVSDSYASFAPDDFGKLNGSSDMLWVSNKIYEAQLADESSHIGNQSSSSYNVELGSSYASLRRAAASRRGRSDSRKCSSHSSSASESTSSLNQNNSSSCSISLSASDASTTIILLEPCGSSFRSDTSSFRTDCESHRSGASSTEYFGEHAETSHSEGLSSSFSSFYSEDCQPPTNGSASRTPTYKNICSSQLGGTIDIEESESDDMLVAIEYAGLGAKHLTHSDSKSIYSSSSGPSSIHQPDDKGIAMVWTENKTKTTTSETLSGQSLQSHFAQSSPAPETDRPHLLSNSRVEKTRLVMLEREGSTPESLSPTTGHHTPKPVMESPAAAQNQTFLAQEKAESTTESQAVVPDSETHSATKVADCDETVETYFDKVSMRWRKRLKAANSHNSSVMAPISKNGTGDRSEPTTVLSRVDSKPATSDNILTVKTFFDKKTMKWVRLAPSVTVQPETASSENSGRMNQSDSQLSAPSKTMGRRQRPKPLGSSLQSINEHKQLTSMEQSSLKDNLPKPTSSTLGSPFMDLPPGLSKSAGTPKADGKPTVEWLKANILPGGSCKQIRCLLCTQNRREVLMVPCRHLSICRACSSRQILTTCPLCERKVTDRMLMF